MKGCKAGSHCGAYKRASRSRCESLPWPSTGQMILNAVAEALTEAWSLRPRHLKNCVQHERPVWRCVSNHIHSLHTYTCAPSA